MMLSPKRVMAKVSLPISWLLLKAHSGSLGPLQRNLSFKYKMLVLLALLFIASNLFVSSLVFNVSNYNHFVEASKNVDFYLRIHRQVFSTPSFVKQFRASKDPQPFVSRNRVFNEFDQTLAETAHWQRLLSVYSNEQQPDLYIAHHPLPFHWADWVDTSPAQAFVHAYDSLKSAFDGDEDKLYLYIHEMCYNQLFDRKVSWVDQETYDQQNNLFEHLQDIGICSAIFKYYYQTLPERVVFEMNDRYVSWPVKQEHMDSPRGVEGLAQMYHGKPHVSHDEVAELRQCNNTDIVHELYDVLGSKGLGKKKISLQPNVEQDPDSFTQPNIDELIKQYDAIERPTKAEIKYLGFLKWSKANVGKAEKFYFTFPFLRGDKRAELHHYNFPWIKQIIHPRERVTVVHHLTRSWFKLCEEAGVVSWFSYGNLIGWFRNSRNMPWDNDIDVQLSIKDMDILGRKWNNSLVLENPTNGNGLFWLQTNPFYLQQNDLQFIDARYIDVKTGIYVDVSALWSTNRSPPAKFKDHDPEKLYHCKHFNWVSHEEIFPLHRTIYEGSQTYRPNDYKAILMHKYGAASMTAMNNFDHNWQKDLGMWVPNQVCENHAIPPTETRFNAKGELTLFGACNNTEVLDEWRNTRQAYALHNKEMELVKKGEDTSALSREDLPLFRFFDYDAYK